MSRSNYKTWKNVDKMQQAIEIDTYEAIWIICLPLPVRHGVVHQVVPPQASDDGVIAQATTPFIELDVIDLDC